MGEVVGVFGSVGGVGASTFAAVLASVAGAVLVDIDACAGGIDVLLGVDDRPGARWSAVRVAGGRIEPAQLRDGLVRWGATPVLAADVAPSAEGAAAVLVAARELAHVVVDLGRSPNAARAAAVDACGVVVLLSPSDAAGVTAARAAVRHVDPARCAVVARQGSASCDEVAEAVGAQAIGDLPALAGRTGRALHPMRLPRAAARLAAGIADGLGR